MFGESLADQPGGQDLGQHDVSEFAFRDQGCRDRRPECDARAGSAGRSEQWQAGCLDGLLPDLGQFAAGEDGGVGRARQDQTPALARRGGRFDWRFDGRFAGRVFHLW